MASSSYARHPGDDPASNSFSYTDDPEFQTISNRLSKQLFTITGIISRLSVQVGLLHKRDTPRVHERIKDIIEEGQAAFKEVAEDLKKLLNWDEDVNTSQRYQQGMLQRECEASLKEFKKLQNTALATVKDEKNAAVDEQQKQQKILAAASNEDADYPSSSHQNQQQQQLQQLQQQEQLRLASQAEVDFQEQNIIERERQIQNIEQSVMELNDLFRDVATIVAEQGEGLISIETNAVDIEAQNRDSDRNLTQAAKYQKNARQTQCCLLIIIAVIFTIVLLAAIV